MLPPIRASRSSRIRVLAFALIGVLGLVSLVLLDKQGTSAGERVVSPRQAGGLVGLLVLAAIPAVRCRAAALWLVVRQIDRRRRWLLPVLAGLFVSVHVTVGGFRTDWGFTYLSIHDTGMHLLQARMISEGVLWLPAHPLAEFFETFHVLSTPVYASAYFPGASLLLALSLKLGGPIWLPSALCAGVMAGVLLAVLRRAVGLGWALLGVLMLPATVMFRMLSLLAMSYLPFLMQSMLLLWLYLRWRRRPALAWAVAIGLMAGWMVITRPLDALIWIAPPLVMAGVDVVRRPTLRRSLALALPVALLASLPMLALQGALNKATSGSYGRMAYTTYIDTMLPNAGFGFHAYDPSRQPATDLPQWHEYYQAFFVPRMTGHNEASPLRLWLEYRGPTLLVGAMPSPLLLIPLMAGLAALRGRLRWALALPLPLFCIAYSFYMNMLMWYPLLIMVSAIALILIGGRAMCAAVPAGWGRWVGVVIAGVTLGNLPPIAHTGQAGYHMPEMRESFVEMPRKIQQPAVVLYRYTPGAPNGYHAEPVYNVDAAAIDDNPIIRAHDRGQANARLIAYYGQRQPERHIYRVDRATGQMTYLGQAGALWAQQLAPAEGRP